MKVSFPNTDEYATLYESAEFQMSWARIIAKTHEMVQEHRKQIGLPPWDFSKPKRANRRSAMLKAWLTRRENKVMAKAAGAGR